PIRRPPTCWRRRWNPAGWIPTTPATCRHSAVSGARWPSPAGRRGGAGGGTRAREVGNNAIDRARAADDPAVLMHTLKASLWHGLTPELCEIQAERSAEVSRMALARRDYEVLGASSHFRAIVSYLGGRPEGLAASTGDMRREGQACGQSGFGFAGG